MNIETKFQVNFMFEFHSNRLSLLQYRICDKKNLNNNFYENLIIRKNDMDIKNCTIKVQCHHSFRVIII